MWIAIACIAMIWGIKIWFIVYYVPQANRRVSGVSSRCSMETAASVPDISERVVRSERINEWISKEENKGLRCPYASPVTWTSFTGAIAIYDQKKKRNKFQLKFFPNFWPSKSWILIRIRIHLKCWIRIRITTLLKTQIFSSFQDS